MSDWLNRTFYCRLGIRGIVASTLAIFGSLSAILQMYALLVPGKLPQGWVWFLLTALASAVVALASQIRRLPICACTKSPDATIAIKVGDLLDEPDHLVIGTNDCFDTEIGNVISQKSLQGQFLSRMYAGDQNKLDLEIANALQGTATPDGDDHGKARGKSIRFPRGTAVAIPAGHRSYFLTAYTRMSNDLVCESDAETILLSLDRLWELVRAKGNGNPVSIPIIGPELARTGLSRMQLLKMIVLSFVCATRRSRVITTKLTIVVHPKDVKQIDFAEVQSFITSVCS